MTIRLVVCVSARPRERGLKPERGAGSAVAAERSGAALDLGVPPHFGREIVGHSAIEVAMTIYAHVSLEEKRKAMRKLGDALK